MVNPSSAWTDEDRKGVIQDILDEMKRTALDTPLLESRRVLAWRERVFLVLNMSDQFLETNRENILHGHPVDRA